MLFYQVQVDCWTKCIIDSRGMLYTIYAECDLTTLKPYSYVLSSLIQAVNNSQVGMEIIMVETKGA